MTASNGSVLGGGDGNMVGGNAQAGGGGNTAGTAAGGSVSGAALSAVGAGTVGNNSMGMGPASNQSSSAQGQGTGSAAGTAGAGAGEGVNGGAAAGSGAGSAHDVGGSTAGQGTQGAQGGESTGVDAATKTDDGQQGDNSNQAASTEGVDQAIEYADFVVPEGVVLNPVLLGEFKDVAKGMNLNQEQAQQLTDLGVKLTQNLLAEQAQAYEAVKASWLEATKADKDIGGVKLEANLSIAAKAVNAFVSPELKVLFNETGLGNHPELVKAFVKIGQAISEDSFVTGTKAVSGGPVDIAKMLYPDLG